MKKWKSNLRRLLSERTPPKDLPLVALAMLMVVAIFVSLTIILLALTSNDFQFQSSFQQDLTHWWPELFLAGAAILLAITTLISRWLISTATAYHHFRTVPIIMIALVVSIEGIRLTSASLMVPAQVGLMSAYVLSALVLGGTHTRAKETVRQAKLMGLLTEFLDEKSWQWSGRLYSELDETWKRLDPDSPKGPSAIWRLHWLAPAAGIYLGRYFADSQILLIAGGGFLILGLVWYRQILKEHALIFELKSWEEAKGKRLLLASAAR